MLFSSYNFIFIFLPPAIMLFYIAGWFGKNTQIYGLLAFSFAFYAYWNILYLPLLLSSIVVNYLLSVVLIKKKQRWALILGLFFNLGLLGWFKYADFFISTSNSLTGSHITSLGIILPLAISFFTFQQIAYLIDAWRGMITETRLSSYALFVAFFPQLIAGPIVHHKEMMPQFAERAGKAIDWSMFAAGLALFSVGLFKKMVIADRLAPLADQIFARAETTAALSGIEAWLGTLAYTFQLYFDFSGYSDMAIGLALLFGIRLPINFNSPYKSTSIIDFWRRWHITLSRFLKDYLYIPLGGNRRGQKRYFGNLMITMLLGGLWHGAGWTFVIWGGLHGIYLVINHLWRLLGARLGLAALPIWVALPVTFLAVVLAWVFFRAESLQGALHMTSLMLGQSGTMLPDLGYDTIRFALKAGDHKSGETIAVLVAAAVTAFALPNTVQYFLQNKEKLRFSPNSKHFVFIVVLWVLIVMLQEDESAFLYFQF